MAAGSQGRFRGGLERGAGRSSSSAGTGGDPVRRRRWLFVAFVTFCESVRRPVFPAPIPGRRRHPSQKATKVTKDKQIGWPCWRRHGPQRESWCPGVQVPDLPDSLQEAFGVGSGSRIAPRSPRPFKSVAGERAPPGGTVGRRAAIQTRPRPRAEPRRGGSLRPSGSAWGTVECTADVDREEEWPSKGAGLTPSPDWPGAPTSAAQPALGDPPRIARGSCPAFRWPGTGG